MAAPTASELETIQRHLVTLPAWEGAEVVDDEVLGVTFVRGVGRGPDMTYAALPRWSVETWRSALDAVRQRMRADRSWPSLLLCDRLDRPIGLGRELARLGWTTVVSETVMWVGHASVVPHLDPGLRIEAVQPRSVELHERLEREIFGIDSNQAERRRQALAAALEGGGARAWIVWLADEPAAVARLSQGPGVAGLQGIGVVEGQRGRGLGTLITTIATRAGLAVGNRLVWLSVHEDNAAARRTYTRTGFQPAFSWARWLEALDRRDA